jgi:hypothetical protein
MPEVAHHPIYTVSRHSQWLLLLHVWDLPQSPSSIGTSRCIQIFSVMGSTRVASYPLGPLCLWQIILILPKGQPGQNLSQYRG